MSVAVTGSIAVDHLMRFPGRFAEQLVPEALANVSLSFLADELTVRHGGVAANIAFGMAQLGLRPTLIVCTTDTDMCQIATFYAGATTESVDIDLTRLLAAALPPPGAHRRGCSRRDAVPRSGMPPVPGGGQNPLARRAGDPGARGAHLRRT